MAGRMLAKCGCAWAGYRVVAGVVEGKAVRDCAEKRRSDSIARGTFLARVEFEYPLWPWVRYPHPYTAHICRGRRHA